MTRASTRLRVGYVVDEGAQPWLVQRLAELGRTAAHYQPVALLVRPPSPETPTLAAMIARSGLRIVSRLEYAIVAPMTGLRGFFRTVPVHALGLPARAATAETIRELGIDILVDGTAAHVLDYATVQAARHGILVPESGATEEAGPAGFHEVRRRDASTGYAIRRFTDAAAPGVTVSRGSVNTAPLWTRTMVDVTRKLAARLHDLLERCGRDGSLHPVDDSPSEQSRRQDAGRRAAAPGLAHQASYLARTLTHGTERVVRRALGARWRWGVAYQFTDDWRNASLGRSRIIPNPANRFYADPFVVRRAGRVVCYVEDFDYRQGRAGISAIELRPDGHQLLGPVLEEPFHLSYPFLFEADGELYMCPETAEAREVRLYRCTDFPCSWTLHAVLMRNIAAVDASILYHGGRWWMLVNVDSAGISDYRSELHVFSADRFDSDSWEPHPRNPVISDSAQARNGGLILQDDGIFRVFQVHGFDVYGQSMGVAQVSVDADHYDETVVARFAPDFFSGIHGTHTLSWNDGVLATDFVRRERPGRG